MSIGLGDIAKTLTIGAQQIGVPYKLGSAPGRSVYGVGKQANFDCSGFVAWTYYQATGVKLPAYTDALAHDSRLTQISASDAIPGDIVLFHFPYGGANWGHTALYAGNGQVLESGSADGSRSAVNTMPLLGGTYKPEFYRLSTALGSTQPVVSGDSAVPTSTTDATGQTSSVASGGGGDGTKLADTPVGPINVPSGLVLGLIAVVLLFLGALLFSQQARNLASGVPTSAI